MALNLVALLEIDGAWSKWGRWIHGSVGELLQLVGLPIRGREKRQRAVRIKLSRADGYKELTPLLWLTEAYKRWRCVLTIKIGSRLDQPV